MPDPVMLSEQSASRLRAQSPLIKKYRETLANERHNFLPLNADESCSAELLNWDLVISRVTGRTQWAMRFSPDVGYNPRGAIVSMIGERSGYTASERNSVIADATRMLLSEAVAYNIVTLPSDAGTLKIFCSLALNDLPKPMGNSIRRGGRCADQNSVPTSGLIEEAIAKLPEPERQFCDRRAYGGYQCLMAATWARSLCNGEVRFSSRRYRLSLCESLDDISPFFFVFQ